MFVWILASPTKLMWGFSVCVYIYIYVYIAWCLWCDVVVGTACAGWWDGSVFCSCNEEHHQRCRDYNRFWLQLPQMVLGSFYTAFRVTTCLKNPEMSGILTPVSEVSERKNLVMELWLKTVDVSYLETFSSTGMIWASLNMGLPHIVGEFSQCLEGGHPVYWSC